MSAEAKKGTNRGRVPAVRMAPETERKYGALSPEERLAQAERLKQEIHQLEFTARLLMVRSLPRKPKKPWIRPTSHREKRLN